MKKPVSRQSLDRPAVVIDSLDDIGTDGRYGPWEPLWEALPSLRRFACRKQSNALQSNPGSWTILLRCSRACNLYR